MAEPAAGPAAGSRTIRVIGIGTGQAEQLSPAARAAVAASSYVIAAAKGDDDPLLAVRRRVARDCGVELLEVADPQRDRSADLDAAGYDRAVRDWHAARVEGYCSVMAEKPGDVAFLVWGDPAFYDSTLRLVDAIAERIEVDVEVIPGICAPQLLAAAHRIVLHPIGGSITVTTGRRLADDVAAGADNLVVMLDGDLACLDLACLDLPEPSGWQIWWGANLGADSERLVAGPLADVAAALRTQREAARAEAGWVMDTYLLRRT